MSTMTSEAQRRVAVAEGTGFFPLEGVSGMSGSVIAVPTGFAKYDQFVCQRHQGQQD
jgi:hypothetical protein